MTSQCLDNTDQVLFHPTIKQTSQQACADGHQCPDGRNQGAATQRRIHLPILYGKECSCSEQTTSVIQPNELVDQLVYHLIASANE